MRVAIDIRRAGDYGVGTYIRNTLYHLGRIDAESNYMLIGTRKHFEEVGPLPENFELLEYAAEPGTLRTHLHLPLVLDRERVDLLHMPWFYAPAVTTCRLLITVHDMTDILHAPRAGSPLVHAGRLYFAKRALNKAVRIVTVSQASKRELARGFQVPEEKVEVIYNALDDRFTREPFPADADRILERLAVADPFVLYAGNIKPQKNLARLIEAFAVAKAELAAEGKFSNLKLVVIGDELAKHPDLRRAVVRTRLREDVRFLGFVQHNVLRAFYARARAFLFPSLYEGFGLPPLEAMAHGTPVVASSVSSLPEVLGQAALLVNPENVFDIARGIRQVLTDEDLRTELVRRGYEQMRRYSWERSARQLLEVYRASVPA